MKEYIQETIKHLHLSPEKTAHLIISITVMVFSGMMALLSTALLIDIVNQFKH